MPPHPACNVHFSPACHTDPAHLRYCTFLDRIVACATALAMDVSLTELWKIGGSRSPLPHPQPNIRRPPGSWGKPLAGALQLFETGILPEEADDSSIEDENAIDSDSDWEDDNGLSEPSRRLSDADPDIFKRRLINGPERLSLITLGLKNKDLRQEVSPETVRKKELKGKDTTRQTIIQNELTKSLMAMLWERLQTSAESDVRRRRDPAFRQRHDRLRTSISARTLTAPLRTEGIGGSSVLWRMTGKGSPGERDRVSFIFVI